MYHRTSVFYNTLIKAEINSHLISLEMEVSSITNMCSALISGKMICSNLINRISDVSSNNDLKLAPLTTVSLITVKKVTIPNLVCNSNNEHCLHQGHTNFRTYRTGSSCIDINNTKQKNEISNINSIVQNISDGNNWAICTPPKCETSQNVIESLTATNVSNEKDRSSKSLSVDSNGGCVLSCPDVNNKLDNLNTQCGFAVSVQTEEKSNTEVTPFCCKVCKKVLASMLNLETHMKSQHSPDGSLFKCKECGKEFLYRCRFERHNHAHLTERQMYPCEECGKTFVSKWTLQNHIDIHYGKNSYDCHLCDKKFRRKPTRDNHVRIDHQGILKDKHFLCTVCGKLFRTNYDLSHHFIKHTDQRPFKCKTCHKTYRNKKHLKDHENVHLSVKPYVCKVCGRRFLHSGNRIKHQRRHSEVRPHECRLCDSSFYEKQELERHFQRHHNENI